MELKFNKGDIPLYYYNEELNLGDLLSPFIIKALSGRNVKHKFYSGRISVLKIFFARLLKKSKFDFGLLSQLIFKNPILYSVGSILGWGGKNACFWGSGFMNYDDVFHGGDVYAVRGKRSIEKLEKLGFGGCKYYGDPALLLPLIVPNPVAVQGRGGAISIIPHVCEVDYFKAKYGERYNIIDLRSDDISGVIKSICSSRYVLSTSLHGIILSHAYGIPALWIYHGNIFTDGFKFADYFSSIEIDEYQGVNNYHELFLTHSDDYIADILESKYKKLLLPKKTVIKNIQNNLLKSAPFKIKEEYRNMLK